MPKFKVGSPQVRFVKRNGREFTKTFHSRSAAARAIKGYRAAGGRVAATGRFSPTRGTYGARSYRW